MRFFPRFLGVFAVLLASVAVQALAQLTATPNPLDLGRGRQEKILTHAVTLTNTGTKPLQILRVAADCSCTAAVPDKTELQPGEKTELQVKFETRVYQGEVHRRLLVQTSEGDLVLPVQALVSPYDDWVLSGSTALLAPSTKGEVARGEFSVRYTGPKDAEIKSIDSDVPWLTARVSEHDGATWKIALEKSPDAPAGNLQPRLTFHTTDAHEPTLTVPAFVSVYSTVAINPNPILLPVGKVGQPMKMPFTIAGWLEKADPRGEIENGRITMQKRDRNNALMLIEMTPKQTGVSTKVLRIFADQSLEVEVPVVVRAEE